MNAGSATRIAVPKVHLGDVAFLSIEHSIDRLWVLGAHEFYQKKVAQPKQLPRGKEAIIREVWDYFRDHGGSIISGIDYVLQHNGYGTNFRDEFPQFAWTNYFLNAGTYTDQVAAYKRLDNLQGNLVNGQEWELFRNILNRQDPAMAAPAVFQQFLAANAVADGPSGNWAREVDNLGIMYLEFKPQQPWPANNPAKLSITIKLSGAGTLQDPANYPKVSMLSIPQNSFAVAPHQPNNYINPVIAAGDLVYATEIAGFDQLDRVAVIVSNFAGFNLSIGSDHAISYSYHVEVKPP